MISKVYSATNVGFDGKLIEVECDASNGLPGLVIVGLGNKEIDEAKERVRSAIKNTKLDFPKKRITINLAPANLPKHGAHFDLAIAVALLVVSGQLPQASIANTMFIGELALDGTVRPVPGILAYTELAKQSGIQNIVLPAENAEQASLVDGVTLLPLKALRDIYLHLGQQQPITPYKQLARHAITSTTHPSLHDVQGQEQAKRALLIAAAGRHNLLLSGPPGAGKTMLARSLISLLPPLSGQEIIEVTKLQSLAGENQHSIITTRPFRSPHHSASHIALTGGGPHPKPGEISLAHHGVLFLDELPEYSRQALESLRQPLEDKYITVARASGSVRFPADFMLIATQNPCPCGYAGDTERECTCSSLSIQAYQKKISGPLLDRIDMVVEVSRVEHTKLLSISRSEALADLNAIINIALNAQERRFSDTRRSNSNMNGKDIHQYAQLSSDAHTFLDKAAKALTLSARAYFKVIKVARTIADLEQSASITQSHISEALQYRARNKV